MDDVRARVQRILKEAEQDTPYGRRVQQRRAFDRNLDYGIIVLLVVDVFLHIF